MVKECLRFNLLFLCDLFGFCYLYFRILGNMHQDTRQKMPDIKNKTNGQLSGGSSPCQIFVLSAFK